MKAVTTICAVLILGFYSPQSCRGDGIDMTTPGPEQAELMNLGFDPTGFFFMTANSAYDYNGSIYELDVIAAAINPVGASSLDGFTTHEIVFLIDGSGNISTILGATSSGGAILSSDADTILTPEPPTMLLFTTCLLAWVYRRSFA